MNSCSSKPGRDPVQKILGLPPKALPSPLSSKRTYSKSVSFLSSVTGLKATTFFRRPITQAESGALANTRPVEAGAWYASPNLQRPSESQVGPVHPTHLCGRHHAASLTSITWPSHPVWSHSSGRRGLEHHPGNRQNHVPGADQGPGGHLTQRGVLGHMKHDHLHVSLQ